MNQHGKWCDSDENVIEDICAHLVSKYKGKKCTGFVYDELAKNGKTYTRLHNYIKSGFDANTKKDVESYMAFMRSKGYLKEAPADSGKTANSVATQVTVDADGIDIANL